MKRILFLMLVFVSFIFIASYDNFAEASDYYLGVYEDGREAYLMEDDIEVFQMYTRNGTPEGHEYQCTVKAVNPEKPDGYEYVFYSVYWTQMVTIKKNDTHYGKKEMGPIWRGEKPVEKALLDYIQELHESKFGKNKL